jgi:hypothetical protein
MSDMIESVLDASVDPRGSGVRLRGKSKTSERVFVLDRIITGLDPMAAADRAGRRLLHYYSVRNLNIFAIPVAMWVRSDTRMRSRSCDHTHRRKTKTAVDRLPVSWG